MISTSVRCGCACYVVFVAACRGSALAEEDVAFELFDAAHGGIEYRYPLALGYRAKRLR